MTVRELMEALSKMNPDALVRIPDTYWMNEGYGPHADDPELLWPKVTEVYEKGGAVRLEADEEDEDGWDEDEEEGWDE